MKVAVVIPTRKGSERVPSKNTKPFVDTTLLDLKIEVMKKVLAVDEIIVNSDCEESWRIAKEHNVKIHKREPYFASNTVTTNEHWRHLAEVTDADVIILGQTTSPLIKPVTYELALSKFMDNLAVGCDSLNTVTSIKDFLWLNGKSLNYEQDKFPRSQDLPDVLALNFGITIIKRDVMVERGNIVGYKPYFMQLDKYEATDIDDPFDFLFAEHLYKNVIDKSQLRSVI